MSDYWSTLPGMVRAARRQIGSGVRGRYFGSTPPAVLNGLGNSGGITIGNVTSTFFRPERVRDPVLAARLRVLSRFGYFVMRDARQSLRHRKNASNRDRPPTSWGNKLNSSHNDLLKRFIFYSQEGTSNVVIGPVPLEGQIARLGIPGVLEYGGQVPNKDRHGKDIISTIEPRPYMHPAFDRQRDKHMPGMFEGSVRP